ncbi:hypothetical protein [Bartonella grahamii]|uniref:hypothetical protein n=1 Tax=Bartonella grahamii TaxID=33045 RepID=UPI002E7AE4C9|nr:hypothetical protein [Bartonella grahamii]
MKGWGALVVNLRGWFLGIGGGCFGGLRCEAVWVRSWGVEYCLQSSAGLGGSFIWLIAVKM